MAIDLGYHPRAWQDSAHRDRKRWTVLVWPRRAGKTEWALMELIDGALHVGAGSRFAYIAPLRVQAQDVVWARLVERAAPIPGIDARKGELAVTLPNGATVQLYGADNPDRLRGIGLDGVVLDEVAQMPPSLFREVLRPALADRAGWAVWIGTPKGRNAFWEVFESTRKRMEDGGEEAHAELRRTSEIRHLPDAELLDARRQMSEEEFEQEFECSFQAAIVGAYYGREMAAMEREGRIMRVPFDPGYPIVTGWDLGHHDSTVIWVAQRAGREVRLLDVIAASGVGLDWYASELRSRAYAGGEHLLPHDGGHADLGTGKTRLETLRSLGLGRVRVLPRADVEEGINAVRRLLPACVADQARCKRGLEALRQYRREWDERNQVFRPRPRHDWTSHYADALRTLAMGWQESADDRQRRVGRLPARAAPWDPYDR